MLRKSLISLLDRVQLAHFCNTSHNQVSLRDHILAVIQRRTFMKYDIDSDSVFTSRAHLVEFQQALLLEYQFQEEDSETIKEEILYQVKSIWDNKLSSEKDFKTQIVFIDLDHEEQNRIFDKDGLLDQEVEQDQHLIRYDPMLVYTRILSEACAFLGQQQRYEEEIGVLKDLLRQMRYRKHHRGKWWDRLLLVMEKVARQRKVGTKVDPMLMKHVIEKGEEALNDPYVALCNLFAMMCLYLE